MAIALLATHIMGYRTQLYERLAERRTSILAHVADDVTAIPLGRP